jgi:hypothetical protein
MIISAGISRLFLDFSDSKAIYSRAAPKINTKMAKILASLMYRNIRRASIHEAFTACFRVAFQSRVNSCHSSALMRGIYGCQTERKN